MSYSVPDPADKPKVGSDVADRTARQRPETLDLGFRTVERRESCLNVTKPSQIGVGWFLAECPFGVLQLLI